MRRPEDFTEYPDAVMSNFDHEIYDQVAAIIKDQPYFSQYAGWNFCGYVWWQDSKWHCEVWTYGQYQQTFSCDTLEDIMSDVSSEYGHD